MGDTQSQTPPKFNLGDEVGARPELSIEKLERRLLAVMQEDC